MNEELIALLRLNTEKQASLTPAEKCEQSLRQGLSYVKGEMGMSYPNLADSTLSAMVAATPVGWALAEIDFLRKRVAKLEKLLEKSQ